MKTKIQKWGNSLAIRIPKTFASEASVEYNADVDVTVENGKIVITPIHEPEYDLNDFLAKIDDNNTHKEVDFGKPEGNEAW